MKKKLEWIRRAASSKVRVTGQGDIFIKSKDVFRNKDKSIKFIASIAKATDFKMKDAKL